MPAAAEEEEEEWLRQHALQVGEIGSLVITPLQGARLVMRPRLPGYHPLSSLVIPPLQGARLVMPPRLPGYHPLSSLVITPLQVHVVLPLPSATARVGRPAGAAAGKEEEAEEEEGEARLSHSLELQFTCIPAQGLLAVTAAKQSATLLLHLLGEDGGTTLPPSRPTDAVLPTASQQKETLLALLPGQPFLWVQVRAQLWVLESAR